MDILPRLPLNRLSARILSSPPHNYLHVTSKIPLPDKEWHHVFFTYDGTAKARGLKLFINGEEAEIEVGFDQLYKSIKPVTPDRSTDFPVEYPWKLDNRPLSLGIVGGQFFYLDNGALKGSLDNIKIFHQHLTALEVKRLFHRENKSAFASVNAAEREKLEHYLHRYHSKYIQLHKELQKLLTERVNLVEGVKEVMVMEETATPRKTYVLYRGQYNSPQEEVGPGTTRKGDAFRGRSTEEPSWVGPVAVRPPQSINRSCDRKSLLANDLRPGHRGNAP